EQCRQDPCDAQPSGHEFSLSPTTAARVGASAAPRSELARSAQNPGVLSKRRAQRASATRDRRHRSDTPAYRSRERAGHAGRISKTWTRFPDHSSTEYRNLPSGETVRMPCGLMPPLGAGVLPTYSSEPSLRTRNTLIPDEAMVPLVLVYATPAANRKSQVG